MFEHKDTIKILSIDGGGIRGLIPALLLAEIEKNCGQISQLFDFFAGTSTGGILTLLLNRPNPLPAEQISKIYQGDDAKKIFKKNIFNILTKGEKYDSKGIESVLSTKLENYCLKDSLNPVLIPSYDMESRNTVFFNNYDNKYNNIFLKDIARATSAAPTYFEPYRINGTRTFVDGGVAVNNPAMSAYVEVIKLLKKSGIDPASKKIIVVSLGTGSATSSITYDEIKNWNPINWVTGPLIPTFFDGNSTTVEYQLKQILPPDCYFRFQLRLPDEKDADKLDNINEKFLNRLKDLTRIYIEQDNIGGLPIGWASKLTTICNALQSTNPVNP